VNNLITGNRVDIQGGGIYCMGASPVLIGNTISENSALISGGGVCCGAISFPAITNTIIWNNDAPTGPEMWIGTSAHPSTAAIRYSDLEGGPASVYVDPGCTLDFGADMLDIDPVFVTGPSGPYYLSQIAAGQATDSPCSDRGNNTAFNLNMNTCWTRTDEVPDSGMVDLGFHYGPFTHPSLTVDIYQIPESTGGTANFPLHAGTDNAHRDYMILGSSTGTSPGTPLPGGHAILPINWDLLTNTILNLINTTIFTGFMGTLDEMGHGAAQMNLPPLPGTTGTVMHFAYALNYPWDFVSNPVAIEIVP